MDWLSSRWRNKQIVLVSSTGVLVPQGESADGLCSRKHRAVTVPWSTDQRVAQIMWSSKKGQRSSHFLQLACVAGFHVYVPGMYAFSKLIWDVQQGSHIVPEEYQIHPVAAACVCKQKVVETLGSLALCRRSGQIPISSRCDREIIYQLWEGCHMEVHLCSDGCSGSSACISPSGEH